MKRNGLDYQKTRWWLSVVLLASLLTFDWGAGFAVADEPSAASKTEQGQSEGAPDRPNPARLFESISAYLDGLHGKGIQSRTEKTYPSAQLRDPGAIAPETMSVQKEFQKDLTADKKLTMDRIGRQDWDLAVVSLRRGQEAALRTASAQESEKLDRLEKFLGRQMRKASAPDSLRSGEIENSVGMKLVVLPSGTFTMGSSDSEIRRVRIDWNVEENMVRPETPAHKVSLSKPFLMGKYGVTVGQFKKFADETGYKTVAEKQGWGWVYDKELKHWERREGVSWRNPGSKMSDDYPVTMICYADAEAFCNWLSKREGRKYELPSEAQWEYAARGGKEGKRFPWGDDYPDGRMLNMADRRSPVPWADRTIDDRSEGPAPVGSYAPNGFGLYDMAGNLWHWCSDYFVPRAYQNRGSSGITDPQGPKSGSKRTVRGGNWAFGAGEARNAFRFGLEANLCTDLTGFRVVSAARQDEVPVSTRNSQVDWERILGEGPFDGVVNSVKKLVAQGRRMEARRLVDGFQKIQGPMELGDSSDFIVEVLDALIDLTEDKSIEAFVNSLGMRMVRAPSGSFVMGSSESDIAWAMATLAQEQPISLENEYPFHKVRISRPFFVSQTEVTVEQFRAFVDATGYRTDAEEAGGGQVFNTRANRFEQKDGSSWKNPGWAVSPSEPVTMVSYDDAQAFVEWLSAKDKLPYKLPTEAQWEYAARGGLPIAQFPWGDGVPDGQRANYADRNTDFEWRDRDADDGYKNVAPVGSYSANGFGLYDMAGNVIEWVRDYSLEDYYRFTPEVDPEGPGHGENRVTKGGDWASGATSLRCAFRGWSRSDLAFNNTGFRVIVDLSSPQHPFHLAENFLSREWVPGPDQRAVAEAVAKEKERQARTEAASRKTAARKPVVEFTVRGLVVLEAPAKSDAAKAGMLKGDVIIEYNGITDLTAETFTEAAAATKRDKIRPIVVFVRDGVEYSVRVGPGFSGMTVSETVVKGPFKKDVPAQDKQREQERNRRTRPEQWT
jgi:formylglycine-generating enzyme required for sulfatase activity